MKIVIDEIGAVSWRDAKDKLHRVDGPAIVGVARLIYPSAAPALSESVRLWFHHGNRCHSRRWRDEHEG